MKPLIVLAAIVLGLIDMKDQAGQNKLAEQNRHGFAVVELFTSEGCSSCPPADKAVAELAGKYKDNVYVLGFHVDYWDQLGWKDIYSNAAYSQRQQRYGALLGLNSIYTPQAIVNGKTELVGSDKSRLESAIGSELNENNGPVITLSAKTETNNTILIAYTVSSRESNILNFALLQSHAQTDVLRGENKGKQLQHVNVVRDFKTVDPAGGNGTVSFSLPKGLAAGDCKIIAYLQDKSNWHITGAAEADVN